MPRQTDPLTTQERAETQALLQVVRPTLMAAIRDFQISEARKATAITKDGTR